MSRHACHTRAHRHTARAEFALPQEAASAGRARKLTSVFLTRPHRHVTKVDAERVDDATLIVSELVTNATRHGRSPCRLRLVVSDDQVTVEVHDASPVSPHVLKADTELKADAERESGARPGDGAAPRSTPRSRRHRPERQDGAGGPGLVRPRGCP